MRRGRLRNRLLCYDAMSGERGGRRAAQNSARTESASGAEYVNEMPSLRIMNMTDTLCRS